MPSTTPLTDAIQALTTYSNTVTGKTPPDTTLSEAVATLAAGYGGGGGSDPWHIKSGELGFNMGSVGADTTAHPIALFESSTSPAVRRCALAFNGDIVVPYKVSSSNYPTGDMYLIPIPATATKIKTTIDRTIQISVFYVTVENGDITSTSAPDGWEDITANTAKENNIPTGANYVVTNFRANSSNANFAYNTIPRKISIDFE